MKKFESDPMRKKMKVKVELSGLKEKCDSDVVPINRYNIYIIWVFSVLLEENLNIII
jgi:hypothetical protein